MKSDSRVSWIVAGAVLLLGLPLLAQSPQGFDGAEQIMAALNGGVLHPPGFPVQAWLNRLFILLPFGSPAARLALLSLLSHAGAVFLIAETLRELGAAPCARILGAAAFGFFPSVWYLGEQPEVFALAHLLMAASLRVAFRLLAARGRKKVPVPVSAGAAAGVVFGLALAQHPITVTFMPAFVAAGWSLYGSDRKRRVARLGVFVVAGGLTGLAAYLSLPLLRTAAIWPDWGKLDSLTGILRHVLRTDYGWVSLSAGGQGTPATGLEILLPALFRSWNLLLPLPILGAVSLLRWPGRPRQAAWVLLGCLACATALLALASVSSSPITMSAVLERFQGPAVLVLAVLTGMGAQAVAERVPVGALAAFVLVWTAGTAASGWRQADARSDTTFDVFRAALSAELPKDAVYVSHSDLESFYGVAATPEATPARFPVEAGLLGRAWYVSEVARKLEPRFVPATLPEEGGFAVIVKAAYDQGAAVVATDAAVLDGYGSPPQMRGLLFYLQKDVHDGYSRETVRAALELCPRLAELGALPPRGHGFTRAKRTYFVSAFGGASLYLASAAGGRDAPAAEAARATAEALQQAENPAAWIAGCATLKAAWKGN